jgi:hypothetical protein
MVGRLKLSLESAACPKCEIELDSKGVQREAEYDDRRGNWSAPGLKGIVYNGPIRNAGTLASA